MIVAITGGLGSGKTAMLTRYGVKSSLHKKVLSNYHLYNVDYETFDLIDLYFNRPELTNYIILADELYTFMDCRTSITKRNRIESYFIAQTRKKNCDLYFTSQYSEFVDWRLMTFVSIWIKMETIWLKSKSTGMMYKHPYLFIATFHDYRDMGNINVDTKTFDGRRWFNEYDTYEPIYPPDDDIETQKILAKRSKPKKK